jgi:cytochrome P450
MNNKNLNPYIIAEQWEEQLQRQAHPFAYRILRTLTNNNEIIRVPKLGVIVSDVKLLKRITTDPRFMKTGEGSSDELWTPLIGNSGLLNMDGDAHRVLRKKIGHMFSPKSIQKLTTELLEDELKVLKTRLQRHKPTDVQLFAAQLSQKVICNIIGVQKEQIPALQYALTQFSNLTGTINLSKKRFNETEIKHFHELLNTILKPAENQWDNPETLKPGTVLHNLYVSKLTREEMRGVVSALIIAGTETITSVIPRMFALLVDSGWTTILKTNPERISDFINETLRYTVPSPIMIRRVSEPISFNLDNGKIFVFEKNERVILSNISACRKLGPFNPNNTEPAEVAQKIWFGAGAHFCIGMPLALQEMTLALQTILDSLEDNQKLVIVDRTVSGKALIPAYQHLIMKIES